MKALRNRNQAAVGVVTVVVIALVALTAYYAESLPVLSNDTTYSAYFADTAGLAVDNDVQVAGVKVGDVTEVELRGNKVLVSFTVNGTRIGDATTASINIKTLLGEKYLALHPKGQGLQDPNEPIPLKRTDTPYQLQDVFKDLSSTVKKIDTKQLATSFEVLSNTLKGTPKYMREALEGLSALSETIASRDEQLAKLLSNTSQVTEIVAKRNKKLQQVIEDGNKLLKELQQRREAIDALLTGTKQLADELSGLVADNREQLRPALEKLSELTGILERNKHNLSRSLKLLAPFVRLGANAIGNGRWFEGYFCGLLPPTYQSDLVTVNKQGCTTPLSAPNQGVDEVGGN